MISTNNLHLYGNRIGTIKFECLRHRSEHEACVQFRDGKLETTCPRCGRRYIMNDKNEFYNDRPLAVISIEIDSEKLSREILGYNHAYEYRKERGWWVE